MRINWWLFWEPLTDLNSNRPVFKLFEIPNDHIWILTSSVQFLIQILLIFEIPNLWTAIKRWMQLVSVQISLHETYKTKSGQPAFKQMHTQKDLKRLKNKHKLLLSHHFFTGCLSSILQPLNPSLLGSCLGVKHEFGKAESLSPSYSNSGVCCFLVDTCFSERHVASLRIAAS